MNDLIQRARGCAEWLDANGITTNAAIMREMADEIENLRNKHVEDALAWSNETKQLLAKIEQLAAEKSKLKQYETKITNELRLLYARQQTETDRLFKLIWDPVVKLPISILKS